MQLIDNGDSETVIVSTLAGSDNYFADGQGSSARFWHPWGVVLDAAGNLYVADSDNDRIRKITPKGEVSTLAGSERGFADGQGSAALFNEPTGIAIDTAGNLYVADTNNHRIRKVTPKGEVSTLAGSGPTGEDNGGFADGQGIAARFDKPRGIAVDAVGNLYVADASNDRIRKVTPEGEVSTFVGSEEGLVDGERSVARFSYPSGIAIDTVGNLYVADAGNDCIRKVTPKGEVSTLAGGEGAERAAWFTLPSGIVIDTAGTLYVADSGNYRICKVTPEGKVSPISDSQGNIIRFNHSYGITIDAAGTLYVTDRNNNSIHKVTPKGEVSTLAGSTYNFADGQGSAARFDYPEGIVIDATGNLYVTDGGKNHRIRKITPKGEVSTLAGNGEQGFADGEGSTARFIFPRRTAIDAAGNLYLTDGCYIRKATPKGEVSTLADGRASFSDGPSYCYPVGIAIDVAGNLYVTVENAGRICKVTPEGEVSTFAGGEKGFADGQGSDARFRHPYGIAIDAAGNLYVTDGFSRIRKITPKGEVSTLAGSRDEWGAFDFADGQGSAARFCSPSGIAIDAAGNLYVADAGNDCIRKVTPKGEVSTLAGNGEPGFADGQGNTARFNCPYDIAIDAAGNLYVTDLGNSRIRKIEFSRS